MSAILVIIYGIPSAGSEEESYKALIINAGKTGFERSRTKTASPVRNTEKKGDGAYRGTVHVRVCAPSI